KVVEDQAQLAKEDNITALKEGFSYLRRSPHITSIIVVLGFSSLLVIPYTSLLPAVAKDLFNGNESTFSWFESAAGFGAMIGAINMARLTSREPLRYRDVISALLMGLSQ
ncbi:MAG: MFS transporter, partial [Sphingobacterium sp.]